MSRRRAWVMLGSVAYLVTAVLVAVLSSRHAYQPQQDALLPFRDESLDSRAGLSEILGVALAVLAFGVHLVTCIIGFRRWRHLPFAIWTAGSAVAGLGFVPMLWVVFRGLALLPPVPRYGPTRVMTVVALSIAALSWLVMSVARYTYDRRQSRA